MRLTFRSISVVNALAIAAGLAGCSDDTSPITGSPDAATAQPDAKVATPDAAAATPDAGNATTVALKAKIDTVVFIYAENRGFDNIYGSFPGANGIPGVSATSTGTVAAQVDRDAAKTVLAKLPRSWTGVTQAGVTPVVTEAQSDDMPNEMIPMQTVYAIDKTVITRDLVHRFYENQMQIDGGKGDSYAAYSDAGGLVMGYYDGSDMAMWKVAQDNVLADNFYQAAFGGSFLNHQYLICGCAPEWPNADTDAAKPVIAAVDTDIAGLFLPRLTLAVASPASALDGPPTYVANGAVSPKDYFKDGTFRGINTLQPAYQPSGNAPAASDATKLFADRSKANTLPPQTETTIGDQLDAKGVTWAWFAGAWNQTVTAATTDRNFGPGTPGAAPQFQFHHQPFNFYSKFDPSTATAYRTQHLKDYTDLTAAATAGTLPSVVFYKPEGDLNQHSGYASIAAGDQHIADVITMLKASPQYAKMVIVVTYDENGGWYDHVAPPKADLLGPGTRIPAIIVSAVGKHGVVDHTQYDTASILRLIERRFDLAPLPGLAARDAALVANGKPAMGDLTNALDL